MRKEIRTGIEHELCKIQHPRHAREQAQGGSAGDQQVEARDIQDKQAVTELDEETSTSNLIKVMQN